MKQNMNIEAEGNELILKNKAGDYVIIPKKYRLEVQDMIKENCHGCIDKLVETLPVMEDYALDGSIIPSWDKVKSVLNPKNWGVDDYTDKGDFDSAYSSARQAGEKEFMWNNKRFNTNYKGTPEQQLKETGITDKQNMPHTFLRNRISKIDQSTQAYESPIKTLYKNIIKGEDYLPKDNDIEQTDMLNIYLGKPQINNSLSISRYKPTISKDIDVEYFKVNKLSNMFPDKIKDLTNPIEIEDIAYKGGDNNDNYIYRGLGRFTIDKGKDEKGDYFSYYDIFDMNPIGKGDLSFGVGKPFEVYDRIYYKDYGDGQKKKMYYSDKELSELDINKKNFDTLALQRELSNRGYKLPKSTKKDGTFDGAWGDETKNAFLEYRKSQNKNKE